MGKLDGKIALITGASRGIGRGIAEGFAAEGASLILTARNEQQLISLASSLEERGTETLALTADVTDEQQVKEVFRRAMERFQRLDILVNNAGIFDGGPIDELSVETWDRVMAVNLRGPFLCTREAFRIMKQQGGGRIINIGSISAQRVRPQSAPYSTSKHGLWGLTQVTALEGRQHGISCSCIHPGNTDVETLADVRRQLKEPVMAVADLVPAIVAMAALPDGINMLESIVLPVDQLYIGRG
ncbi:MAG TPA: SDR family oxidoreductase [Blastocatellia bacterium]|jgi:NAD(P)-dependent dehydrogenase (short-subunit alcohol dehydrogenase family)